MFIVQAIVRARTELIVYFLLSSWLESLDHDGRARAIPAKAKQLPIRGMRDVRQRLAVVREKIGQRSAGSPSDMRSLEEAAAALSVACEQLRNLETEDARTVAERPVRAGMRS
ncbi:MAG TPA: hypothetical protein VD867_03895 [Burkholderiales bacterium]|nr:hypothetical protein [Burkholderiales bacterium]